MKRSPLVLAFGLFAVGACDSVVEPDSASFAIDNAPTGIAIGGGNNGTWVYNTTNELNEASAAPGRVGQAAPHVLFTSVGVGEVTLTLRNPSVALACFEWRIDGQVAYASGTPTDHYFLKTFGSNEKVYPFQCLAAGGSDVVKTFTASETVDIRHAFGAENDWFFDWTQFYVLSLENKDQCKDGEWEALGFKNQGQCVRFVETGKDSRIGQ